jgi:single-strand DNA-binding protein
MPNGSFFAFDGNLVRDAELTHVGEKQTALSKFSIACNTGYGRYEKTHFFDCEFWGAPAEAINQYLTKGKSITCYGEILQDRFEDRETGSKRSKVKFRVVTVSMHGGGGQRSQTEGYDPPNDGAAEPDSYDDEIPF